MNIGQKVKLKKYKDYNSTSTNRNYSYTGKMVDLAEAGAFLEVNCIDDRCVSLKDSSGNHWNFHKDDVIFKFNLENK